MGLGDAQVDCLNSLYRQKLKRGDPKSQRRGGSNFMGELTLLQFYQNYLPVSAFISVKEFYDMHYIAFVLIETSTALWSFGKI